MPNKKIKRPRKKKLAQPEIEIPIAAPPVIASEDVEILDIENVVPENEATQNPYLVPASIVLAGLLIAAAVLYTNNSSSRNSPPPNENNQAVNVLENLKPITTDDHILGDPKATIKIVEFSDTECPFCKMFHQTMHQVINEYGPKKQVAWIYRHLPLDGLHPKARKEAEATECAAKLGGHEAFWKYLDRIFEITPSNNGLDPQELPKIAEHVGLEPKAFRECLESGEFKNKVQTQVEEAASIGGRGTPYSVLIAPDGQKFAVSGAQPYESLKEVIDQMLSKKRGDQK